MARPMFRKADRAWFAKEAASVFARHGVATAPPPYALLTYETRIEAEPYIIGGARAYASLSMSQRSAHFHLGQSGGGPTPNLRSVPGYNTGCGWRGEPSHKWNEYAHPSESDRLSEARATLASLDEFLKVNGARPMNDPEREAMRLEHERWDADFAAYVPIAA